MLKKFLFLFLRVWRAPSVVVLRRTINRLDLFLYDITRFYFENTLHKRAGARLPTFGSVRRFLRLRKKLRNGLVAVARLSEIPVRVLPSHQMGRNVLGAYCRSSASREIQLLDVEEHNPWVLAHELGHHFSIAQGDSTESGADEEGRAIVRFSLDENEARWLYTLTRERLPADGRQRRSLLLAGPTITLSLVVVGLLLKAFSLRSGAFIFDMGWIQMLLAGVWSSGNSSARLEYRPRKKDNRIAKLMRLAFDRRAAPGETANALAAINQLSKKTTGD